VPWLVPSARVGIGRTLPLDATSGLPVRISYTWATLDLCPAGTSGSKSLSVAACIRGELGSLAARPLVHPGGDPRDHLRGLMGTVARVRWTIGSGEIRPIVETHAGLLYELSGRDELLLAQYLGVMQPGVDGDPPVRLPRPSPWAFTFGLSAGIAFR
jgi:hypothetical protein